MAAVLLLGSAFANLSAEEDRREDVPAWVETHVRSEAEVLAGLLGLPRTPFIDLTYSGPVATLGLRSVHGRAEPERFFVALSGDWQEPHPDARRQLTRNIAHEAAHVFQYAIGEPTEGRMLHEGFAEAMAVEALLACGAGCAGDGTGLEAKLRRQCGEALRAGIILAQDTPQSAYGCGGVLTLEGARAAGVPVTELYRLFAAGGRDEEALIAVFGERAGPNFAVSAKAFLTGDYRLAKPSDVFERLRAGRL